MRRLLIPTFAVLSVGCASETETPSRQFAFETSTPDRSQANAEAHPQGNAAPPTSRDGITGSWKSPNLGLSFPIWMVDHYDADGRVTTEFHSQRGDTPVHHKEKDKVRQWRLHEGHLEIGSLAPGGEFTTDGLPRRIEHDSSGGIQSIGGWTPLPDVVDRDESASSQH